MSADDAKPLIIVSGLPRSGTSMMMKMLDAGGLGVVTDGERVQDADNPGGYYEFEPVKKTKEDPSWLEGTGGKAVKMIYRLLYDLPADRSYKVLFMRRKLEEVLASQKVMLQRNGKASDEVSDDAMATMFRNELDAFYAWEAEQSHLDLIDVDYNQIQANPPEVIATINDFLGGGLDVGAMAAVLDPSLYRNRSSTA